MGLIALSFAMNMSMTPFGARPARCVHHVRAHELVHIEGGVERVVDLRTGVARVVPPCTESPTERKERAARREYDGWLAYTAYNTSDPQGFTRFDGDFSVPNDPKYPAEVLYVFTGLQNVDWIPIVDPEPPVFDIIQPVLQYSWLGWEVSNWYVTLNSNTYQSDLIDTNAGSTITSYMAQNASDAGAWKVFAADKTSGRSTTLNVRNAERLTVQPWAYTTIECYGCGGGCDYLPSEALAFTSMALTVGGGHSEQAVWKAYTTPNPVCHTMAHIKDSSDVSYTFQR